MLQVACWVKKLGLPSKVQEEEQVSNRTMHADCAAGGMVCRVNAEVKGTTEVAL